MITIINVNEFFPYLYLIRSIGKVNKTKIDPGQDRFCLF